jgi:hypothetical protein
LARQLGRATESIRFNRNAISLNRAPANSPFLEIEIRPHFHPLTAAPF